MSDLFEQVFHHINGSETEIQNWQTLDGIKTVEFQSFGPDRWIESVHERGRMTGIECLAIILFALDESLFDPEPARRIVEGWAAELRKAVSTGEIHARDPFTLLALPTLPDGWEWLLSTADANKFIAARGMTWRFDELARQLFTEFERAIQKRRFPPWAWEPKQPAPATDSAAPAPAAHSVGGESSTPWHLMASPHELCAAFGTFTGMNKDWFTNLNDKPALKAARFQPGLGGRNKVEPLFYVYPVLQWLIDKRRKTGKPMQEATGWRMLKLHFPKVYEAYELNAPDPD